jgi:hypothetical protein
MRNRVRVVTTALATVALATGLLAGPVGPAAAAPSRPDRPGAPTQGCETDQNDDGGGTHVGVGCPGDDDTGDNGGPGDDGPGHDGGPGIDPAEACAGYPGWGDCETVVAMNGIHPDQMCGYVVAPDQSLLKYYQPDAPDGSVLLYFICPREGNYYTEDTQWAPAGAVVAPPTPAEVAETAWAAVQAELLRPTLDTWPPSNMSSVLNLPSFVSVSNWQGPVPRHACDVGVCVDLLATPSLTFEPGEPDAEGHHVTVACEPGGTTFDRYGDEPDDQAGGDACAHTFWQRTGVDGRPRRWPGVVSVTWNVHWEGGGDEGDFDPLVLSTALPRAVTEWVSVVTGVASGGR